MTLDLAYPDHMVSTYIIHTFKGNYPQNIQLAFWMIAGTILKWRLFLHIGCVRLPISDFGHENKTRSYCGVSGRLEKDYSMR